jgi:hypothetical protein
MRRNGAASKAVDVPLHASPPGPKKSVSHGLSADY